MDLKLGQLIRKTREKNNRWKDERVARIVSNKTGVSEEAVLEAMAELYKPRKSLRTVGIVAGVITAIGALAAIGYYAIAGGSPEVPSKQKSTIHTGRNTYEDAVSIEAARQACLDRLVARESERFKEYKSFNAVIYDPGFRIMNKGASRKTTTREGYGLRIKGIRARAFATTDIVKRGTKPNCYVDSICFDPNFITSEDELLSLLDNESSHAHESATNQLKIKSTGINIDYENKVLAYVYEKEPKLAKKASELFSFDLQFQRIISGERKVSDKFIGGMISYYRALYDHFKSLSKEKSIQGDFAKIILNSQNVSPYQVKQTFVH